MQTVSGKLILLIKAGYWLALLIIAAMVVASFILLQQVMATQRHNHTLLDIVSTQKTLSQRIVFLAGATGAASRDKQPALVNALKQATAEFETNYDLLLKQTAADPKSPARLDPKTIENVLFGKPFHLDYFSVGLVANGERLVSAFSSQLALGDNGGYKGGYERVTLDASVANATLSGYSALGQRISAFADERSEKDARSAPHAVLRHDRRHRSGGAVHLPAHVKRDPAQDARTRRCAQFDGLHRRS
ncbi:hypothetical protein [Mesorhizobium sp. ORM16]|uniref:hypothetical protein n=1 Tax=Mesorhizobium sp. ORM16 TaxID=3376989 RepID=UPI003857545E